MSDGAQTPHEELELARRPVVGGEPEEQHADITADISDEESTLRGHNPEASCSFKSSIARPLLHVGHPPLRSSQALFDAALDRTEAALSSAVPTTTWNLHHGEWLVWKSELAQTGVSCRSLT